MYERCSNSTMSDTPKMKLIQDLQQGLISPEESVKAFQSLPANGQKGGRVYNPKSTDERKAQYASARRVRSAARQARIPFVSKFFLPDFYLGQGLTIVGAESGRAKSTTCANILHGYLQSVRDRPALVLANEEAADAVYDRSACIALKSSYTEFFRGSASPGEERRVVDYVENQIIPRVEVIEDGAYDMSYLEDVQSVLETAATSNVGLVLIDYLQAITQSRKQPDLEAFQISKLFGHYLKDYGKRNGFPVVCFVQLHPESVGPTMASRIQNDKTIFNHAFTAIEIKPDFETLTTVFKVHKDRFFGHTGAEVTCAFKGGRYVFNGEESL
jgi:hypothetical protein